MVEAEFIDIDDIDAWGDRQTRWTKFGWWWSRTWNRFAHEPWYWLKCRLWHQYNVVRIKTLPPTWMDRDEVLLHAAFQIFCDFVEREKPTEFEKTWQEYYDLYFGDGDFPGAAEHAKQRADDAQVLKDLYRWWTVDRPARKDPFDLPEGYSKEELNAAGEAEEAMHKEDEEMLVKLCRFRRHLWT